MEVLKHKKHLTGNGPESASSVDFNNDSITDLVVANSNDNTISVLLGNKNGTFQNQTTYKAMEINQYL